MICDWSIDYVYKQDGSHKVITYVIKEEGGIKFNKEIIDITNLSDEFINKIVKAHNDIISNLYEQGLRDGIKIMKEEKVVLDNE